MSVHETSEVRARLKNVPWPCKLSKYQTFSEATFCAFHSVCAGYIWVKATAATQESECSKSEAAAATKHR